MGLRLLPGVPFLVASLLVGSSIPRDLGLILFAPVGEETVKLFFAFAILHLWQRIIKLRKAGVPSRFIPTFSPLIVGLSFGVLEHYYRYSNEMPGILVARLITHVLFVTISFGLCRDLWLKGAGVAHGLWSGLAVGMFLHSFSNWLSLR